MDSFPKVTMLFLKKICYLFIILASSFVIHSSVFAVNYPSPAGYVNDFADIYSSEFETKLENKLADFEKATESEFTVVTVESLEGEQVENYAVKLFEKWQIGKKKEDNGLLLLISEKDREVRFEVGYGLEPYLTDGRAGEIIRRDIVPNFKEAKYEEGTEKAVDDSIKYISAKDIAPAEKLQKDNDGFPVIAVIFGIYFLGTYLASFLGRTKEIWPGGAIGGLLGVIIGLIISSLFIAVFLGLFAGLFGLFLDFILSRNYKIRKDKGLPTGFWPSGGGFRTGGGGSSFGGFGGGSSGGGGASGRW